MKLLTIAIFFCLGEIAFAQTDSSRTEQMPDLEKKILIVEYLKITEAQKYIDQTVDYLIMRWRNTVPSAPEEFWEDMRSSIETEEFLAEMIGIYETFFTTEEMKVIVEFYKTEAGQKMLSVENKIFERARAIGENWVLEKGKIIEKRLKEAGFIKNKNIE